MAIFTLANLKKAYRYGSKNGFLPAFYAAVERTFYQKERYEKRILQPEERRAQEETLWEHREMFSILVPAYDTQIGHFHEMIDSVLRQTYPVFELIIADASPSDKLKEELKYYKDSRIIYKKLAKNRGISENTNEALQWAKGSYICLLDHDDVLEADALYRMMEAIERERKQSRRLPWILYSDEDKGDGEMSLFYEPHRKMKFNLDLLLSNNYICHFLVMKAELMKELGFRKEFDGAQDHDLVLRAVGRLGLSGEGIIHVPCVLYHWRCHTRSTALNPQSKMYAYEAGRRAVEDFCRQQGWKAEVIHTRHLGYFRVAYEGEILQQRSDLAAVGGSFLTRGRIAGGAYTEEGEILYRGLPKQFSGYMHRAILQQDVFAVDIRHIQVREELIPLLKDIEKKEKDVAAASLMFGREAAARGYRILWDPVIKIMRQTSSR